MKLLSEISKINPSREEKIVHFHTSSWGELPINPPCKASEFKCPYCGERNYFLMMHGPEKRVWACNNVCVGSKLPRSDRAISIKVDGKRSLEWPLFCEMNGIGNAYYDVKFENIDQAQPKLDYLSKFVAFPKGIILMQGDAGTGKTYAAMALCEFFTRANESCIFTTQKQMSSDWLLAQSDKLNNYVSRISNVRLLIIDDFATGEPTSKFLEFFMDLINTRNQWKERATVITTNLEGKEFNLFCGEALSDRIMTGQIMKFKGSSRRKKVIL